MAENKKLDDFSEELTEEINIDGDIEPYIISVLDDDDKERKFEMIDAIETDEGRYLALLPVFENVTDIIDDDGDLVILKVLKDSNGDEVLVTIDDADEFEEVVGIFEDRLAEIFEIQQDENFKDEF